MLSELAISDDAFSEYAISDDAISDDAIYDDGISEDAISDNAISDDAMSHPKGINGGVASPYPHLSIGSRGVKRCDIASYEVF